LYAAKHHQIFSFTHQPVFLFDVFIWHNFCHCTFQQIRMVLVFWPDFSTSDSQSDIFCHLLAFSETQMVLSDFIKPAYLLFPRSEPYFYLISQRKEHCDA